MTQLADKLQPWIAAIEERPQGGPRWLQELRDRGAARFSALGFPTTRDEEWRYTSVAAIASTEFRLAAQGRLTAAELEGFVYTDAATRLVIVDGHFSPELSRTSGLPAGTRFGSLASAIVEEGDAVARFLGQLAEFGSRGFSALNTAFLNDGAFVKIPDGVVLDVPLQVVFVSTGNSSSMSAPRMSHPRLLLIAGERSQSRVIETYVGVGDSAYFTNAVTEVVRRRKRRRRSLQGSGRGLAGVPRCQHARARRPERDLFIALVHAWRKADAERRVRSSRRRGRGVHA